MQAAEAAAAEGWEAEAAVVGWQLAMAAAAVVTGEGVAAAAVVAAEAATLMRRLCFNGASRGGDVSVR